jgi:DEAD/DEAH box helicase domain-containing protein
VAALLLMCDPRDLGVALTEEMRPGVDAFEPNLHFYDSYPGGIGLSAPLYELRHRLLAGALDLIRGCACEEGCPSCVGPMGETGVHAKEGAIRILEALTH